MAQIKREIVDAGFNVREFTTCEELGELVLADWSDMIRHSCGVELCLAQSPGESWFSSELLYREWIVRTAHLKPVTHCYEPRSMRAMLQ